MTPVSGNNPNMQLYSFGASKISGAVTQACGQNSEVSQMVGKLPSIINGSYDPMGDVVDALPISNPTVKLVVGSALDILKTWLMHGKGDDIKDAKGAQSKAQAQGQQMMSDKTDTESNVSGIMTEVQGRAESDSSEIEGQKSTIDELEEQNRLAHEEIETLTQRNEEIDQEIAQLLSDNNVTMPEPPKANGEEGETPPENGGINLEALPESIRGDVERLLSEKGDNLGIIATNNQTITANQGTIQEGYQQIDQLASGIMSTIEQGKSAVTELTNVLSGKQKMFSQEQLINAGTQLAKSTINGTEGGVLAAFATAAGVSSVFSFGATAMQAEQAAEASADKFASVPARVASQVAIKMAESVAKQAVQGALSQLSSATGVNFNQIYTDAMQLYSMASAGNANATLETPSGSTPTTPTTPSTPKTPAAQPPEKKDPATPPPATT